MCKQASYTKYQKRIIKFLNDLLGSEIPFKYERTQSNHLKVLIDGVPKPIYTGSTPSDCKSLNNFMADVKRELKASKVVLQSPLKSKDPVAIRQQKDSLSKLMQSCIKSCRTRIDVLKQREVEAVIANKSVDVIATLRDEVIKHSLSHALQGRKAIGYIKPREMRELEGMLSKHLAFMLPTLAFYSELISAKNKIKPVVMEEGKPERKLDLVAVSLQKKNDFARTSNSSASNDSKAIEPVALLNTQQSSAQELMSLSKANRVSLLRGVTKAQALELIEDIQQAMAMNREQDIDAVISMIQEKDLPLEMIISRMEAA
ncbi:hypothetical protein GNP82_16935 [Aliivibrio fischeri]|uniref:hypothetical protein n=1 Tax=Aliivibrio fischeri TaxID=668 RepID=UPI0012D87E39|nr:hypothetical protein [Aliivibrio fischeri]MUK39237.1 hypothetical protein [Aliivibrio fischeri]MUL08102.1 hypothetical protein [Aliivibrio fischeri]